MDADAFTKVPLDDMPEMVELSVDADSFMAGMLVGILASEPDGGMQGFRHRNGDGHVGGDRNVSHVLANGSCFEGYGNPAALRAIYDASFKGAAAQPGGCPGTHESDGVGAYVTVFPMATIGGPPLAF
jgi:hypothetical protein